MKQITSHPYINIYIYQYINSYQFISIQLSSYINNHPLLLTLLHPFLTAESSYQGSRRCWWGRVHRQWWGLNCRAVGRLTWLLPVDQEEENTELLPKPQEDGQNRLQEKRSFEQKDQANLPTQAKLGPSVCDFICLSYLISLQLTWSSQKSKASTRYQRMDLA